MQRARLSLLALAAATALAGSAARADSIRCDGGIVSSGDSKLDLLGKCGAPTLREAQSEEQSWRMVDRASRTSSSRTAVTTVERWTYNFGPRQFVQVVVLESGRVRAVERGGYGYDLGQVRQPEPAIPRARCNYLGFHEGDTTFEVLARCGEPAAVDLKVVTVSQGDGGGTAYQVESRTSTLEIWTYDFGPSTFVRRLTFADGRVIKIATGGYGYSR